MSAPARAARVFVITGPSGVGKGTLIALLRERIPELALSVSATTRAPRAGERNGVAYWFLGEDEFAGRVDAGDFAEWAEYSGRRYGTLKSELERHTAEGRPVVLEIEVQGARQIRETMPGAVQIFISPPSEDALRERLTGRGTDEPAEVARRMEVAADEVAAAGEFEHRVVNDDLAAAVGALERIVAGTLAA